MQQCEEVLEKINDKIDKYSEMTYQERFFLTNLILEHKPQKILEVGVAAGASSLVILNAIRENNYGELYSIDYNEKYYRDNTKTTGFLVKELFPEFMDKWQFFSGGLCANYLDYIGKDIDFCFIDTVHSTPGEILDFLMILPYLKESAIVVLHDIALHQNSEYRTANVNCMLYSAIKGQKLVLWEPKYIAFGNIGGIILDKDIKERVYDIFNLLIMPWHYELNDNDYKVLIDHLSKFYDSKLLSIFVKAKELNHRFLENAENEPKICNINTLNNKKIRKMFWYMLLSKVTFGCTKQMFSEKLQELKNS